MEVKSPIFEFMLKKCDVQLMKNYSNDFYGPMRHNDTKSDFLDPLNLIFSSCALIVIIFTNFHLDKEKTKSQLFFVLKSPNIKEFFYVVSCLLASIFFLPFILLISITFKIYREYVKHHYLLKNKKLKFVDFMTGEDTVWVCENNNSKSIINVLAFINSNNAINENLPNELLNSIKSKVFSKLVLTNRFPKLFYRRQRDPSGYFYWTNDNSLSINNYVRFLDRFNESIVIKDEEMKRQMSEICNNSLPANNSALWECLIGQQAVQYIDGIKYPVIFRIHHSVGDGVALLRLFLETLADNEDIKIENNPLLTDMKDSLYLKFLRLISFIYTIIKTPSVLCSQIRKEIDYNQIHPTILTGKKKINWIYESELGSTSSLLTVVKALKRKFPGSRFSNILLAALSKSLRDFFEQKNYKIPKEMTVVIPARLYNMKEDPTLKMENKFSVALQTIPIDVNKTDDRMKKIQNYSDIVISSPDYQINYFMMAVVAAVFPDWILKTIMYSKHATMAISNLPGPNFTIKINGYEFESVGFFLPNLDQTACGLTILSYDNRLHFGMMADESSIESEEDLGNILKGMINELQNMAENFLK
ncbi:hypothetical protein PVAND_000833 [Polypedilum vanderplanki]|uniref:O-acyltransferase WSD1 C-terminal domain-containing protein n=1 Tax=Polypedilum vanderplanki TaxID=319348 RepID=A0A9J6BLE1_POLVA|nr:hypothetical protein PVAND_000833 [Polypedilum vanderplanki]